MPKDIRPSGESFDLDKLRELVAMMEQHGLTDVSLRRGDEHWRLRRGATEMFVGGMPQPTVTVPLTSAAQTPTAPVAEKRDESLLVIKSPTVGTYYSAPSPDDPPFVQIGSRISPDTTVCIIEAMKVFNQIPAEVGGTIVEILVQNGDPVEFGQPLFRIRPG